ncbi:MAG: adenylyltransferase/cytidyltransferase family protein [Rickettsiales bacterium]|jgi:nicotinamide-nucleotide adenylyltransferase|nr:adenylyltransferase/cytidyltransferase family protein [Rickettsiales bacterium]
MKRYKHSFLTGRFQPFHNGHRSLIDKMLRETVNSTIIVGSAQESRTEKNPFNTEERFLMLDNIYGHGKNIRMFALDNIPNDDEWYGHVLKNIKNNCFPFGKPEAFYCGGLEEASWFDKGELAIEILDRKKQIGYFDISATSIRNMIKNHDDSWKKFIPEENLELVEKLLTQIPNNPS